MHFVDVIAEYVDITQIGDSNDILPGLERCKKSELLDICARISMALPRPRAQKTPFSYVGNSAVSGFPYPCDAFNCRSQNFASAVGFAAIYADESIFFDPFIEIGGTMLSLKGKVPVGLVQELSFYIRQILMARPLIDRGICVFETAEHERYCSKCFSHAVSLISKGTSFAKDPGIFVSLIQDYAKSSSVTYHGKSGNFFVYRASARDELSDHDIYRYSPNKIGGSRIKKGQELNPSQVLQLGIPQKFAHFVSFDILGTNAALNAGTRNSITTTPYVNSLS
ncbi:MAG TPA: hypothetical protein VN036_04330, partial [Devosia sp.]|nr:hypothetical protein [Devosia sp.]